MAIHQFEFRGGVYTPAPGKVYKFLLFLINAKREISFAEACKFQLVTQVREDVPSALVPLLQESRRRSHGHVFETQIPHAKLMVHETSFGEPRLFCQLYFSLGESLDGQLIQVRPYSPDARRTEFLFSAPAKFLKKSEALNLLEEGSKSYTILKKTELPPIPILREMVTISYRKAQGEEGVRRLRIRPDRKD